MNYSVRTLNLGLVALLLLGSGATLCWAAPEKQAGGLPIEITADGDNRFEGGIAYASGNVVVRYGTDVLYTDSMAYNPKTKDVFAVGHVRIYSGATVYRGDKLGYNFDTKILKSDGFRMLDFPLMAGGDEVTTPGPNHYRIHNGYFTTDNRENPAYRIQANTVEIYPDDRVVLKNLLVYIGDVPIMWFPVYTQSLTDDRSNFAFRVGSNGRFGPFLLTTYSWTHNQNWRGTLHFDVRQKRGFGGGLDLEYKPNPVSNPSDLATLRTYYALDNDPNNNRTGLVRQPIDENRYLMEYKMRYAFAYDLHVITDVNVWSDQYIKEDFYPEEVKVERQPDNMLEVLQYTPTFTGSILIRQQFNDFFETVERSPEVKIETKRQKIFGSPIAYEGESSMVNFSREYPKRAGYPFSPLPYPFGISDYEAYRFDTFHQFSYPRQYFNWLNVTPRVGFRGTYYQNERLDVNNGFDSRANMKDEARLAANAGLEASFKVSKTWSDSQDKQWGVNGLRHVAEPFVNAQFMPPPTSRPKDILQFDSQLPNTQAPQINFPANNSIDSIDRQGIVRYGARNKLQTKRDGRNHDLIDWVLYADLDFEKQFYQNVMGNVYSELEIKPVPWLTLKSFTTFSPMGEDANESNNGFLWQANAALELGGGYRYLQNFDRDGYNVFSAEPTIPDSNLFYLTTFYRMNEDWQFETLHNFEANGLYLQEQQYRIYRDLSAWQLAVTLADRNNRRGDHELVGYFTLTLKAFPKQEISLNPSK